MKTFFLLIVLIKFRDTSGNKFEPKIIKGRFSRAHQFPFAAFLVTMRPNNGGAMACGSSILNQDFLITAAHCFDKCKGECLIVATIGNANISEGLKAVSADYKVHEHYDFFRIHNDIAVARLTESLVLGRYVKRVAVLKKTFYHEPGVIAGWGLTESNRLSNDLKYLTQVAKTREECIKLLGDMPPGTICGKTRYRDEGYIAVGDSGSGLIIRDFIAIGLVSYKEGDKQEYIVFTDISYHHAWIHRNTRRMQCRVNK